MPKLGRFFRFVESGFARRKSKTRLFRCLETSIPMLAVLMLLFFWNTNKLFVHTFMCLHIPEREFSVWSHNSNEILFVCTLTYVAGASWYSEFHFCRISRVDECYASKPLPSGGAFIRVSKFQVNLGCPNRQRKCFLTTEIFRCNWNQHQLQRCVENAATKCEIHRKASLMVEFSRISTININLLPPWR